MLLLVCLLLVTARVYVAQQVRQTISSSIPKGEYGEPIRIEGAAYSVDNPVRVTVQPQSGHIVTVFFSQFHNAPGWETDGKGGWTYSMWPASSDTAVISFFSKEKKTGSTYSDTDCVQGQEYYCRWEGTSYYYEDCVLIPEGLCLNDSAPILYASPRANILLGYKCMPLAT